MTDPNETLPLVQAYKEIDRLKVELAKAQAENARLSELASLKLSRNRIKELQTEIERLKAALDLHEHEIIELHGHLETESAHRLECQQIIYGLRAELAKAQAENAMLAAYVLAHDRTGDWPDEARSALRDLLAPTVELLERCNTTLRQLCLPEQPIHLSLREELTRLTALMEGKV